jgi:hypothetical protein
MLRDLTLPEAVRLELVALAPRYLWWDASHSTARLVAQIMNLGTYADILRLEGMVPRETLVDVMANAEPGWFSDRSWDFWNGRLHAGLAEHPPVRVFARAS